MFIVSRPAHGMLAGDDPRRAFGVDERNKVRSRYSPRIWLAGKVEVTA